MIKQTSPCSKGIFFQRNPFGHSDIRKKITTSPLYRSPLLRTVYSIGAIHQPAQLGIFTLQVTLGSMQKTILQVEIYNMLGEKISNLTITGLLRNIDLSAQPSGIYLYRVISESGILFQRNPFGQGEGKFVITK